MAGEPTRPPSEEEEEAQGPEEVPFFDVHAAGSGRISVSAGWMTAEEDPTVVESVLDYDGPIGTAESAVQTGFRWYLAQVQQAAQAQAQEHGE
jgi:hypothetical protein